MNGVRSRSNRLPQHLREALGRLNKTIPPGDLWMLARGTILRAERLALLLTRRALPSVGIRDADCFTLWQTGPNRSH